MIENEIKRVTSVIVPPKDANPLWNSIIRPG